MSTPMSTLAAEQKLAQDTQALLRMFSQGGTMAGLYGLGQRDLEALYAFGLGHYNQGRYADALKVFARLVTLAHGEPRYLNALAACHQMLGQHEQAVHFYGVSQLLDASDPLPTFHTATSLLALGHVTDAIDALELVLTQAKGKSEHAVLQQRAQATLDLVKSKLAAGSAA